MPSSSEHGELENLRDADASVICLLLMIGQVFGRPAQISDQAVVFVGGDDLLSSILAFFQARNLRRFLLFQLAEKFSRLAQRGRDDRHLVIDCRGGPSVPLALRSI